MNKNIGKWQVMVWDWSTDEPNLYKSHIVKNYEKARKKIEKYKKENPKLERHCFEILLNNNWYKK